MTISHSDLRDVAENYTVSFTAALLQIQQKIKQDLPTMKRISALPNDLVGSLIYLQALTGAITHHFGVLEVITGENALEGFYEMMEMNRDHFFSAYEEKKNEFWKAFNETKKIKGWDFGSYMED